MQQPFIIKKGNGPKTKYGQASRLWAGYHEINRSTGRSVSIPGLGSANVTEGTGNYDQRTLSIRAQHSELGIAPVWARGSSTGSANLYVHVRNDAAALKRAVRRIRPQEAVEIDQVDADITELEEKIRQLRKTREELVVHAWTKAHTVRLNEVQPLKGEHKRIIEEGGVLS